MFTKRNARSVRRRGMILMVVLAMLTLFAIVGISFVYVASAQETSARIARESETEFKPRIDPEAALSFAFGQLLYDANDDATGSYSALRGHSLARNMYGWCNYTNTVRIGTKDVDVQEVLNDRPFSGVGRIAFKHDSVSDANLDNAPPPPFINENDIKLMNYIQFKKFENNMYVPEFPLRDPERVPMKDSNDKLQYRETVSERNDWKEDPNNPKKKPRIQQAYVPIGGVPYTYPDHNNYFLAQIDPFDGTIHTPSFHREYLFGRLDLRKDKPNSSSVPFKDYNPYWEEDPKGKYYTLRPTPGYHTVTNPAPDNTKVSFPMPIDRNGDVKNLDGVPGGADSIWIDINAPVMVAPQLKATAGPKKGIGPLKYKMLVAPLILELDGRIDLNAVGNLMGGKKPPDGDHRSNQGWGAWEINPAKVLDWKDPNDPNAKVTEWKNIFYGSKTDDKARYTGRYDTNMDSDATRSRIPLGPEIGQNGRRMRGWSQVDFNSANDKDTNDRTASEKYKVPTAGEAGGYFAFPDFPTDTFKNGKMGNAATVDENKDHAQLYWPQRPRDATGTDKGGNRRFPLKDLMRVLRDGGTGTDQFDSDLRGLLKGNLWTGDYASRRRNLITLLSADLDRPGATPYVWDPKATNTAAGESDSKDTRYQLFQDGYRYSLSPSGMGVTKNVGIPFPDPFKYRTKSSGMPATTSLNSPGGSDFDKDTWRNTLAALNQRNVPSAKPALVQQPRQRLNLLRSLYKYPTPPSGKDQIDLTDMTKDGNNKTVAEQLDQAVKDRQRFAADIFNALRHAAGAGTAEINDTDDGAMKPMLVKGYARTIFEDDGPDTPQFRALRALAQIAVNIVDYLDDDGISTVFKWAEFRKDSDPTQADPDKSHYVYGYELPRLLINETYVQLDNSTDASIDQNSNPPKVMKGQKYHLKVWVELMNPLPDDAGVYDPDNKQNGFKDTTAVLETTGAMGDEPIYRIVLAEDGLNAEPEDPMVPNGNKKPGDLRKPDNVTGAVDPAKVLKTMKKWGMEKKVTPATDRFEDAGKKANGFFSVGPKIDPKHFEDPKNANNKSDPKIPMTNEGSADMYYEIDADKYDMSDAAELKKAKPTVLLQRLANPTMPLNEDKASANYNPWITVDFAEHGDIDGGMMMPQKRFIDGRYYDTNDKRMPVAMNERKSWARRQPFRAADVKEYDMGMGNNPNTDQPMHSFFRQNSKVTTKGALDGATSDEILKLPFDWMVHLDRVPNSPAELWHVSAVAPHLVTQDFAQEETNMMGMKEYKAHKHVVPWDAAEARLYRFFEFVSVPPQGSETVDVKPDANAPTSIRGNPGLPVQVDRVMGKVNINTVWNRSVFRALADAQDGNIFKGTSPDEDKTVDDIFSKLVKSRSPKVAEHTDDGKPTGKKIGDFYFDSSKKDKEGLRPTDKNLVEAVQQELKDYMALASTAAEMDRPFWSLAMGYKAGNGVFAGREGDTGIDDTILRSNYLDVPDADPMKPNHPYQKKELLRKLFNNLTTRSNVYAVWLTVGFFEVTDDATQPVKLGLEIGKAENRNIRYRMFAIVDRTNFRAFETKWNGDYTLPTNWKQGDPVEIKLTWDSGTSDKITDPRTKRVWPVQEGTVLTIEPNTGDEESVVVFKDKDDGDKLKARFQRTHTKDCRVICRGNPGPITQYNPREDVDAVPFFMLID